MEKSFAVDEELPQESVEAETESKTEIKPVEVDEPKTEWELLHDIYFKKRFTRPLNASTESLMEDEEECAVNLMNLYEEKGNDSSKDESESSPQKIRAPSVQKEPSVDTLDVIDELIKSIEKEVLEEVNNELPIVADPNEN